VAIEILSLYEGEMAVAAEAVTCYDCDTDSDHSCDCYSASDV